VGVTAWDDYGALAAEENDDEDDEFVIVDCQ